MKQSWISPFIEGLQSVLDVTGMVKGVLTATVADGLESGYRRIAPRVVRLGIVIALVFVGVAGIALGLGIFLEHLLNWAGLGYLLTGVLFLIAGSFYYALHR